MLLDIIVPHAKESWDVVRPFFDMINSQKGIDFDDFRIYLIHDGVKKFPDSYFDGPSHVEQIELPKCGVSAVRNYGIEHSDATWINFSDCDDCFSSVISLNLLFNVLKKEPEFDMMWGTFYSIEGEHISVYDSFNSVFIHNKYYRRSMLIEKNIRFCEKLYMSEDSAFNNLVCLELNNENVGQIITSFPIYIWCRRVNSVTLTQGNWIYLTNGHFDRNVYVLEQYIRHHRYHLAACTTYKTLTDAYVMLSRTGYTADPEPVIQKARQFYLENEKIVHSLDPKDSDTVFRNSNLEFCPIKSERKTEEQFKEWLKELKGEE